MVGKEKGPSGPLKACYNQAFVFSFYLPTCSFKNSAWLDSSSLAAALSSEVAELV
jgi:hypothetical protein